MSKKELQVIKDRIVRVLRIQNMNPDEITRELSRPLREKVREAMFHLIAENKIRVTLDWRAELREIENQKN